MDVQKKKMLTNVEIRTFLFCGLQATSFDTIDEEMNQTLVKAYDMI